MNDICACKGKDTEINCPLKQDCFRYTSRKDRYQEWFSGIPYDKLTNECEFFMENKTKSQE